ncbi:MAG: class I SAM-dependent methyltransferase [Vampirovibrionales bacterium]|nr:class I SAM-dependent methyltransferase [Vampirovibrionales bacterium]
MSVSSPASPVLDGVDPCAALYQTIFGFTQGRLLFSAIELDIFTRIAQGCDAAPALSKAVGADLRAMRIFLDGLVGAGLLQKSPQSPDAYTIPAAYAPYLVQGAPHYLGGLIVHGRRLSDAWGALTEVLRRGRPSGRAQALTVVEEQFAELVSGMAILHEASAEQLAQALSQRELTPAPGANGLRILDIGCGTGHWSAALLRAFPASVATLVDFRRVIEVAARYMAQHGLSDRVTTVAGDLEELSFDPMAYDVVILANLCHAIGPSAAQEALKKAAQALAPGGSLIIVESLADVQRAQPGWPLIFGVNMLVSTDEGDVLTQAQCDAWLSVLGFAASEAIALEPPLTALLCAAPAPR